MVVPRDLSGIFFELVKRIWVNSTCVGAELVVLLHRSASCNRLFVQITVYTYQSIDFKITLVRHIGPHVTGRIGQLNNHPGVKPVTHPCVSCYFLIGQSSRMHLMTRLVVSNS